MDKHMKQIVISAVNLRKGGTLTILRQCLAFLSEWAPAHGYQVTALVHKSELADYPHIRYIELPWAIDGWGKRLWCEYVTMGRISRELGEIDLWFSLHDTTPRVQAKRQAVYCQTSFPFLRWRWSDFRFDKKIPLFAMFTRFAYQFGIRRNRYLVVQQQWLREGFSQMFGLPQERFIVAPPQREPAIRIEAEHQGKHIPTFLFASTPDAHKNFELLAEATRLLELRVGTRKFRTIFTVKGEENAYARWLYQRWGSVDSLHFAGFMSPEALRALYAQTDCLVFPSRIETWGLPISEFLPYDRPMLLSDLPYAHETAAGARRVGFFDPYDVEALADLMEAVLRGDERQLTSVQPRAMASPSATSWAELFECLLSPSDEAEEEHHTSPKR